jgi:Domain of unknown function (DUF4389)
MSTPSYPVRLVGGHDLERSRLTVFFRIFLLIPHAIVLFFFAIAAYIVVIIAWFAALFTGRVPEGMHNFIAGFMRYYARVLAYGTILADPFPPFGPGGSYPVDLEIDPPVAQNRLTVFFRLILAIPCWFVTSILQYLLELLAIGNWILGVILGRVPNGMQTLGMFCLRFMTRTQSYIFLVNPRYPAFGDTPGTLPTDQSALPPLP